MNRHLPDVRLFLSPDGEGSGATTETATVVAETTTTETAKEKPKEGGFQPITDQAKLDEIIQGRLTRQEHKLRTDLTASIRQQLADEAKAAKAKSDGDFEQLYQAEIAKRESTEKELATERRAALFARVATKHNLPETFRERLKGETAEELEADAKELAKHVGVRQAPDTEGGSGTRTGGRTTQQATVKPTEPGTLPDGTKKKAWPV